MTLRNSQELVRLSASPQRRNVAVGWSAPPVSCEISFPPNFQHAPAKIGVNLDKT